MLFFCQSMFIPDLFEGQNRTPTLHDGMNGVTTMYPLLNLTLPNSDNFHRMIL